MISVSGAAPTKLTEQHQKIEQHPATRYPVVYLVERKIRSGRCRMEQRPGIPLSKAIQDLRAELLQVVAEGEGKDLRFKLQPIELELQLAVTWSGEAKAGVKFWVIELGGTGSTERGSTQKLKLMLDPIYKGGGALVSDEQGERPS
jgi:hypothetical protein